MRLSKFMLLVYVFITTAVYSQVPQNERDALMAFYNATDGDN